MRGALVASALLLLACAEDDPDADAGVNVEAGGEQDAGSDAEVRQAPLLGEELINACARTSACGITGHPVLANCVDAYFKLYRPLGLSPIYDGIYRCVNGAGGDCDAMAACFDRRGECEQDYKATCEGDVAVSCDLIDNKVYAFSCAEAKMTCAVKSGQTAAASCTPGPCDSSFKIRCDGDRRLSCAQGIIEVLDCRAEGKFCVDSKAGPICRGNRRETCDKLAPSCLKNVAVSCVQGRVHWDDCDRYEGMTSRCQAGTCVAAQTTCDHTMNRCNGGRLEACLDGAWRLVDCVALGLGPCESQSKPPSSWANCTVKKPPQP